MPEIETMSSQDRTKEITDKLEQGIKELFEGDKFREYLNTMSKFHNYSFNNTMLISMQKPDATFVAGFNAWKKNFERSVNKGEKGIQIFAPSPYTIKKEQTKIDEDTNLPVLDENGEPVTEEVEVKIPSFKIVSVFDVSQTNGKDLPTLGVDELQGKVEDYEKFFSVLKEVSPVPIEFKEITNGAKGYFSSTDNLIAINKDMSEVQTIKTAIHEIAHAKLHNRDLKKSDLDKPKDRNTEEVEAESIAYTVCQHFGIDTSDYSFAYVATWGTGKDVPELKSSLETIRDTANELINKISDKLLGLEKEQEQVKEASDKSNIIGNTAYSAIEDKQYFRLKTSTAEQVAQKLTERNVPFSGRINGDKTTLTVGLANVDSYKEAIGEVTGKENFKPQPEKKSNIIGNTAYRDIQEKNFVKLETETALAVANILDEKGVKFSGKIDGEKTILTISKLDMDLYKESLNAVKGQTIENKQPEKIDSEPDHFSIPIVLHDYITAKKSGDEAVYNWRESKKENKRCNESIIKAISDNSKPLGFGTQFDSKKALEQVLSEYPFDRVALLIAHQVIPDKNRLENPNLIDGRYSDTVQEWAKAQITEHEDFAFENFDYCFFADKSHPVLVNDFALGFIEKQHNLENTVAEDVQQEAVENLPVYDGKLPDESISVQEMNEYGYSYEEMLPLCEKKALELYDEDCPVYLLYEDDTEGMAEQRSDIENHKGIFGIEKADWNRYLEKSEQLEKLSTEEPSKEAILMNGKEDAVGIYQLKRNSENREISFMSLDYLHEKNKSPDRNNYSLVYSYKEDLSDADNLPQFLENVFEKFNIDRPKDFTGHSLSVSDVVVIKKNGELSAHYVDNFGFKELQNFGSIEKNPLKAVEDTIEQNDNSFDGTINNEPPVAELEAKAKSGQPISVMDLCNAVKREQKENNVKPEQKRSIRQFLKQQVNKQPENKDRAKEKGMEI